MKCWWTAMILVISLLVGTSSADWVILKVDIKKPSADASAGKQGVGPGIGPGPGFKGKGGLPMNPNNPNQKEKGSPPPMQPPGSFIYVPVEVKGLPTLEDKHKYYQLDPIGGTKVLAYVVPAHQVAKNQDLLVVIPTPTVLVQFGKEYARAKKANFAPDSLIKLAKWTLEHGLISDKIPVKGPQDKILYAPQDKFHFVMDKLREADPKNATLAALDKVQDEFFKNPPPPSALDPRLRQRGADGSPALVEHFKSAKYQTYPIQAEAPSHYTIFHNLGSSNEVEKGIHERLDKMEVTYLSYFYWFALQGKPQPMPKFRLGVVLTNTNNQDERSRAKKIAADFNPGPLTLNGFTARRDNLVILPSTRIDPLFQDFSRVNSQEWPKEGFTTFKQLLNPTTEQWRKWQDAKKVVRFEERGCFWLPAYQARALAQKHMDEETDLNNITHECSRQLCIATNLLPRYVALPEWFQYGLPSFFETPAPAFYRCMALPNWTEWIHFDFYVVKGKNITEDTSRDILKGILLDVIKDRYFRKALQTAQYLADVKADKVPMPPAKNAEEDPLKALEDQSRKDTRLARSSAWALTYYLAKNKLNLLLRYSAALNRLPRDMDLDGAILEKCFTDALQGDAPSMADLAHDWFRYMRGVHLENFSLYADLVRADLQAEDSPPMTKKEEENKK